MPVQWLHHDVIVLGAERLDLAEIARDQGRRHQIGKVGDENLLRRVAHMRGVVDDKRFRVNALEQMRAGDIGQIKRRVLAQQHDVEIGQRDPRWLTEREMVASLVAHAQGFDAGEQPAIELGEAFGRVITQNVAALLRFQQQGKSRVAFDVDPLDRIHLHRDCQGHAHLRCQSLRKTNR